MAMARALPDSGRRRDSGPTGYHTAPRVASAHDGPAQGDHGRPMGPFPILPTPSTTTPTPRITTRPSFVPTNASSPPLDGAEAVTSLKGDIDTTAPGESPLA